MNSQSKLMSKVALFDIKTPKQLEKKVVFTHEGALSTSNIVLAKHKNTNTWLLAHILQVRLSKKYISSQPKTANSYEYYVHFLKQDKRNDCWLTFDQIEQTDKQLPIDVDQELSKQLANLHPNDNPHSGLSPQELQMHLKLTKFKTIQKIMIYKFLADTWYYSPYPRHYQNLQILYICQYCLNFYAKASELKRHDRNCPLYHPPGDQIYRDQKLNISIFQVDGLKNATYCQNLGYLSKLFLDHKNLLHDMSIFFFYILCQIVDNTFHIVGYFSKAKQSTNNLSCILIFPFYQKKGYGKFLIDFSYHLSIVQNKIGTPQRPFSTQGRDTYLAYWTQKIIDVILENPNKEYALSDISYVTAIAEEDIKWTFEKHDLIRIIDDETIICTDTDLLKEIYKDCGRPTIQINKKAIHYVPWRKWKAESRSSQSETKSEQTEST